MMAPPLIQLKDIALTFGGTPLLEGVELSVSAGERVALVGRNGRREDRGIAAADFSRDWFLAGLPFEARVGADGAITVVDKK